jgi:hypothetical protein
MGVHSLTIATMNYVATLKAPGTDRRHCNHSAYHITRNSAIPSLKALELTVGSATTVLTTSPQHFAAGTSGFIRAQ